MEVGGGLSPPLRIHDGPKRIVQYPPPHLPALFFFTPYSDAAKESAIFLVSGWKRAAAAKPNVKIRAARAGLRVIPRTTVVV